MTRLKTLTCCTLSSATHFDWLCWTRKHFYQPWP